MEYQDFITLKYHSRQSEIYCPAYGFLLLFSPRGEKPSANVYAVSGIEMVNAEKDFSLIRLGN